MKQAYEQLSLTDLARGSSAWLLAPLLLLVGLMELGDGPEWEGWEAMMEADCIEGPECEELGARVALRFRLFLYTPVAVLMASCAAGWLAWKEDWPRTFRLWLLLHHAAPLVLLSFPLTRTAWPKMRLALLAYGLPILLSLLNALWILAGEFVTNRRNRNAQREHTETSSVGGESRETEHAPDEP